MAQPTTTNQVAVFIDGLVKVLMTGAEGAVEAYILASPFAWLEAPVISIVTNWLIGMIGNSISTNVQNLIAVAVIDVQTNLEKSQASQAVANLKAAQAAGDQNAIDKANADFNTAMGALTHWDGSAPPSV